MTHVVLIQSSLRKDSRTAEVVRIAHEEITRKGSSATTIDLRDYTLPFCDARSFDDYLQEFPDVGRIAEILRSADAFVIAFPVYAYTYSGVLKNFIDIFGGFFKKKYFGIIANAGGSNGYMASNDLINIMLYDFHSMAVMPQVYSFSSHFEKEGDGWQLVHPKPLEKVGQMVEELLFRAELELQRVEIRKQ